MQWELVAGKYMRARPDASLEDKGRAKGKKGSKGKAATGAAALQGFRKYTSPAGIQVTQHAALTCMLWLSPVTDLTLLLLTPAAY